MDNIWDTQLVKIRLEEAADTLKRLPGAFPKARLCSWPEIIREQWEMYGYHAAEVRLGAPSSKAIDEMDEALAWFRWLEPRESKIIWLRANHVRWKVITARLNLDRSTAWRLWTYALIKIGAHLNQEGKLI